MQKPHTLYSLQKRILAILIAISFVFCCLLCRLFFVQVVQGNSLQNKALSQWTRDLSLIAPRGDIFDCTGSVLSTSFTTYNLFARGREIVNADVTAQKISQILKMEFSSVYTKITQKNISEVLLKMQISSEQAEQIYECNLSGIYLSENMNRYYPYGDLATQLLGFVSSDNVGQSGIEACFDDVLSGENGFSFTQSDLQGKEIGGSLRQYVDSEKGEDLILTIDSKIQLALEQALFQAYNEQKAKSVTGLVMNVKTGEVLAMSSKPSFNLNEIPRDDLNTLFDNSKLKAITDSYEPGSTFKILTVAIALEEGLVDFDDRFFCGGSCQVDGQKIKCWKSLGHGSQNLIEGFANSCNCVFTSLAQKIGIETFYEYIEKFGLGKKTGFPMTGESSGIVMKEESVKIVDLARIGFGHAIAVTPIQLITAVSSICNGGNLLTPSLISSSEDNFKNSTISKETSEKVNFLLQEATNKIAPCSFVEGYNVGGKTGTAQKYKETGGVDPGKYISSFLGTYPANDPEYAVLLTVDEPSAGAYYGGIVAGPYGKIFFNSLFDYLGEEKQTDIVLEDVEMPDLVGMSLSQAIEKLALLKINFELDGEGGVVEKQLPPAKTIIKQGDTIVLVV